LLSASVSRARCVVSFGLTNALGCLCAPLVTMQHFVREFVCRRREVFSRRLAGQAQGRGVGPGKERFLPSRQAGLAALGMTAVRAVGMATGVGGAEFC